MKRIFSVLVPIVIITIACPAQKNNVPKAIIDAFTLKFPSATNVKWGKESAREYEAEFKMNDKEVSANFRLDGSWVETETTINSSELPPGVTNALNTKYPGAVISLAEKIEKPGTNIRYEVNIKMNGKKKELELDAEGEFVK
jgi:Putative beta-lactamase-inhibitor-like, PepSY-like